MFKPGGAIAVQCGVICLSSVLLVACSGDASSPILDTDDSPDEVVESSLAGASAGLTLALPKYADRPVTFALIDDANGAFAIDSSTGIVTLAGSVDFETEPSETIIAEANVKSGARTTKFRRRFTIQVLDSPAPTLDIAFPFSHANISDAAVSITGRVEHPQLSSVTVVARTDDGTAIPLTSGRRFNFPSLPLHPNQTSVAEIVASHPGGERTSTFVTVGRQPDISYVERFVLDPTHDRFLLADRYSGALVAIDIESGMRTLLSGMNAGSGPSLGQPGALALDALNQRAYVFDTDARDLISIDIPSGTREVLAGWEHGEGPMLLDATEMVFDSTRNVLFVSDDGQKAVIAVDPATGRRSIVSSTQTSGSSIDFYRGLALDAARNRLVVSDSSSIFGVDIATGAANVIHDWNANQTSTFLQGLSEVSSGYVYVADEFKNGVARVDLSSGVRTMITSSGLAVVDPQPAIGTGPTLEWPMDVAYDAVRDRVYVMEVDFGDALIEVSPNGDRRTLADASVGTGINFRGLRGLEFDPSEHTLYAIDYVADILVAIDPSNGNRRLISGPANGRGTIEQSPLDVVLDGSRSVLYVVDFQTDSLYSLNVETGERTVIADASTGTGPALYRPQRLELDAESGVVYVLNLDSSIIRVDVATGARSLLGDASLGGVTGITLDAENRVLYAAEGHSGAVRSVDLATGAISTVSSGVPFFSSVGAIAFDRTENRILMIEDYPVRLLSVDIATGRRSIISGELGFAGTPPLGNGTRLGGPVDIEIDEERRIGYVSDDQYDALFAIDLVSGDRQLISK